MIILDRSLDPRYDRRYAQTRTQRADPDVSAMVPDQKTVLCIDDYETAAAGWCLYLQNAGYVVETAYSAEEGLQLFATTAVDLVLLDYAMPEINGGELAKTMKTMKPHVPIVMLTGVSEIPERDRVQVDALILKGQHPTLVLEKIGQLLKRPEQAA